VPGSSPVWCGNQYGKGAYHESHESGQKTKSRSKVETEESQVEVQEKDDPNAYRLDDEEERILHLPNRKQAVLQVRKHRCRS
jgi:hypothetical protein